MNCPDCGRPIPPGQGCPWMLKLCADAGKEREFELCIECDEALNDHILRVTGDPDRVAKMDAYRNRA